jgi:hypothetical protein
MTVREFPGVSPQKPERRKPGRPKGSVGEKGKAIRAAVQQLRSEYDVMTVRQVFYALMVRGLVPKDEKLGYGPVQRQVLAMREEGVLPFEFIADNTRWRRKPQTWGSARAAIRHLQATYRRNLWQQQHVRVEVWMEKDALAGIVYDATEIWDVALMVSRGQSSSTFLHEAAIVAKGAWEQGGIRTQVFTLYDHDLAGQRAVASIERKLKKYAGDGVPITCEHLAVTEKQIREWSLPTRPAKEDDSQIAVELDAIPPDKLTALVDGSIAGLVDPHRWRVNQVVEEDELKWLERLAGAA